MNTYIITTLIALCGILITFTFSYATFRHRERKDNKTAGRSDGVIMSDIGYIKAGVDDLKRDIKESTQKIDALTERVARCEESTKQAHRRINELKDVHGAD